MTNNLTLGVIKNRSLFVDIYIKLLSGTLTNNEKKFILSSAILFLRSNNELIRKFGYRIIVLYSNKTEDYRPLYEISINEGLYPISSYIERNNLVKSNSSVFIELNSAFMENFHKNYIYLTEQQEDLYQSINEQIENTVAIIAPTSYGKTDLIIELLTKCEKSNICILTPTKSLLYQTRKRIVNKKIPWIKKIVVNPEMYNINDDSCVAVLTQERLLRLIKEQKDLKFDYVVVDEAHNLLNDENRDRLLASTIIILKHRNSDVKIKFFTPFLSDSQDLSPKFISLDIKELRVNEYVKTEKLFYYDCKNHTGLSLYDQFLNKWIPFTDFPPNINSIEFIKQKAGCKNIIYFNKPIDIENFTLNFIQALPEIILEEKLSKAIENIASYVSDNYYLVKALRKGVIYHHGAVPDSIKSYIEFLYSNCIQIKYVITSSTLLEGVNLPADKMFIMDPRKGDSKLSSSNYRNLIGRVCRFSEIFGKTSNDLKKLEPEIFVIDNDYCRKNGNIKKHIQDCFNVLKDQGENVENILLENSESLTKEKDISETKQFLENFEPGTVNEDSIKKVTTRIGESLIGNHITEFNILENEVQLNLKLEKLFDNKQVNTIDALMILICDYFLSLAVTDENLQRFSELPTRKYYMMVLNWMKDNQPLAVSVMSTVAYWKKLIKNKKSTVVYVSRWGDMTSNNGYMKYWTDVSKKSQLELINLAIVRVKEEQDFVTNTLFKFVDVLNDLGILNDNFYQELKYGTTDKNKIILIKNGLSTNLANLLVSKYESFINIDEKNNTYYFLPSIINEMKKNNENEVEIYEVSSNLI